MPHALDASSYVHLGLWINQDAGGLRGLTLTVSPATSTLITNLMALFVTMAGGQFWTILRFIMHQLRALSRNSALDPAHHRQQVVLRNTTTATATAQILIYMGWLSRKDASRISKSGSVMPIIILAILCAIFFVVAGAFSNTLMDAGPYVLSRSPLCGFFRQSYLDIVALGAEPQTVAQETMLVDYISWFVRDVERGQQYSQDCYAVDDSGSANCNTFRRSTLPIATFDNGTCPFDPKLCLEGVDTVVFDTGHINTHKDLGINAAEEDRLIYRRLNNCTVLNGSPYVTDWVNQSGSLTTQPSWRIANASYGSSLDWKLDGNVTYSYSNFADFYTAMADDYSLSYSLGSDQSYMKLGSPDDGSTFVPLPEFKQSDADLYLFHLSYIGLYLEPVDDPWFAAHLPYDLTIPNGNVVVTYKRDRPITTLACTEQHQFCTSPDDCSPALGIDQVQNHVNTAMHLTPRQNVTFNQMLWNVNMADLFQIANALATVTSPLLAIQKRQNGRHTISVPLPDDQWKMELANWMAISMAFLQRITVESETGQIAAQSEFLQPPVTDSEKWICQNLMIRSDAYQSFGVVALCLMLVFGTIVIVLSFVIQPLSACLLRKLGRGERGNEIWKAHDMLGPQLWGSRLEAVKAGGPQSRPLRNDGLASWDTSSGHTNEKGRKRVSSQALSFDDHERLLIAKAYESWI